MPSMICITGAAGQVGKVVTRAALARGYSVLGLDLPSQSGLPVSSTYSYVQSDIRDAGTLYDLMKSHRCDSMIHLAAVLNNPNRTVKGREYSENEIYNINTNMSYNILQVSTKLGIKDIVQASSVNAVGMLGSNPPLIDYLPIDEKHPLRPQSAYDLSKQVCEIQADSFALANPDIRIASLRYHWVVEPSLLSAKALDHRKGEKKDLWGYIPEEDTAEATLLGLTAPRTTFPNGHEAFFVVAPTQHQQASSDALIQESYPRTEKRRRWKGNEGLYDCSKAEKLLGWKPKVSFPWFPNL